MRCGRPMSMIASSAARTERPVNSTSSTKHNTFAADVLRQLSRRQLHRRAARREVVAVQSDVQRTDRHRLALDLLDRVARRCASGTPRVCMPSSTRSRVPLCASTISCAMRTMARRTSSEVINTRSDTNRPPIRGSGANSGSCRLGGYAGALHRRLPFRPRGTGLKGQVGFQYSSAGGGAGQPTEENRHLLCRSPLPIVALEPVLPPAPLSNHKSRRSGIRSSGGPTLP